MGNTQQLHRVDKNTVEENAQPRSIFNCMAISDNCCNTTDEVQANAASEVDNTNKNRIQAKQKIKGQKFGGCSDTRRSQARASSIMSDKHLATVGTENSQCNDSIGPRMNSQVKQMRNNTRFFSNDPTVENSARASAVEANLTKGACFNNRNEHIMTSQRDKPYQDCRQQYLSNNMIKQNTLVDKLQVISAQRQHRSNTDLRIGLQLSGRHYYDTPSEGASRADHLRRSPAKAALTEVNQSVGDESPPDVDNRETNFSPAINRIPAYLKNLDNDELEIKSIHSQRLYTTSPNGMKAKKQSKVTNVRKSKRQLFPELNKLKSVVTKEQSRNKTSFQQNVVLQKAQTQKTQQARKLKALVNQMRGGKMTNGHSNTAARSQLMIEDLPTEIVQFLDKAKGRHPTVTTQSGSIYVGEMMGQKQHGQGFCQSEDKSYYFGSYLMGKRHGRGTFVERNGCKYNGDWENDLKTGEGLIILSNGTQYQGSWLKDKYHGRGREIFPDKSSFEGEYQEGKKHGNGKLVCPDGGIYKGQFLMNQINGHGIYTWPDGIMYEGQWVNNKKTGQGCLRWLDGSREYRGEFKDDERHGEGTYEWDFGNKSYRGLWRNGLKDGIGFVRDELDYIEKKGLWFCGKLVKWMPKDDEDEGQDGESVVSQDIVDWEGHQSNFLQQKVDGLARSSHQRNLSKQSSLTCKVPTSTKNRNMIEKQRSQEMITEQKVPQQSRLQTEVPYMNEQSNLTLNLQRSSNGNTTSNRLGTLTFRKATEEVKRLTVKRKQITKRIRDTSKGSNDATSRQNSQNSRFIPQANRGMLSLDKRVALVGGKDLQEFNPPEIWDEMQKQYGHCNDLPSPKFVNREIVIDVDEESKADRESEEMECFEFRLQDGNHLESNESF